MIGIQIDNHTGENTHHQLMLMMFEDLRTPKTTVNTVIIGKEIVIFLLSINQFSEFFQVSFKVF